MQKEGGVQRVKLLVALQPCRVPVDAQQASSRLYLLVKV